MKKILLASLSVLLFLNTVTAQTACYGDRYLKQTFNDFVLTSDISYGQNIDYMGINTDLLLDVYEPDGDTAALRPLLILAHGGFFLAGSKTGEDVVGLAQSLAKMGYVVASINYRLGMEGIPFPGPTSKAATEAVLRATQDGRAAVRFFRKDIHENGNAYKIDSTQIYFGGVSAGGFLGVQLAYLDELSEIPAIVDLSKADLAGGIDGNSGNPGYSWKVNAIINDCGALGDTAWIKAGDIPTMSLHGTNDGTVPYDYGYIVLAGINITQVYGSEYIYQRTSNLGMDDCLKTFEGAGHVPHCCGHANQEQYFDTTLNRISMYLSHRICNTDLWGCDGMAEFPASVVEVEANNFSVFPNPTSGNAMVQFESQAVATVEVYSVLGNRVLVTQVAAGQQTIELHTEGLAKGLYIVALKDANQTILNRTELLLQ